MRAEIISVGTELLLGDIVNTNAQYLARELAALGFTVYYQSVVGDNPARLRALVLEAKERSDVLLFTGGLGPTADDLTKETVAEAFGDSLVLDEEELVKLEAFFKKLNRPMAPNNRKQAMVPRRGQKLNNPAGTAPGAYFRQGNKYAVLMPGPPREMRPMFENEVRPLLETLQEGAIRSKTLHVIGMGESDLEMAVKDLLDGGNPTAALYAKEGEVHVRITAKAAAAEQADYMCEEMAGIFRQILGDLIYSEDDSDLAATCVKLLAQRGESVALAESCTGGLLAQRITAVPGSSEVFGYGAVSYANACKQKMLAVRGGTLRRHGAVSSQVCAEMAFGAAKKGAATYGVGITGIAGPGGGSEEKPVGLVYVGVARGKQVFIRKLNVAGRDRDYVRTIATQNALEMLRRVILGLDIPGAKSFTAAQHADYERIGRPRRRGGGIVRLLVAILLVAAVFGLLVLGSYFLQSSKLPLKAVYPAAQGLRYGSEEYKKAAQALIRQEKEANPAVTGFVALPGGLVESLVAQSREDQASLPNALDGPGMQGMAVLGKNAGLGAAHSNTVLAGGGALRPILELADTARAGDISTFIYYTPSEERVYEVFAAAYLDENETQPDGFDPSRLSVTGYNEYLNFLLGARGRSLYSIPLDVGENDSYMTLQTEDPAVPGRYFFLFGRLGRAGEGASTPPAQPAGVPLMPKAYYEKAGLPQPDFEEYYGRWLRGFLTGDMDNMQLQLRAGMPAKDTAPSVLIYPEEETAADSASAAALGADTPEGEEAASAPAEGAAETAASSTPAAAEAPVSVAQALRLAQRQSQNQSQSQSLPYAMAASMPEARLPAKSDMTTAAPPPSSVAPASGSSSLAGAQSGSDAAPQAGSGSQSGGTAQSGSTAQSKPAAQPTILRPDPRFLTVRMNGVLVRDSCTNVLAAICQNEMADASPAAIQAQAVAVHSWVLNQQGGGNPAPAVCGQMPSLAMKDTVDAVSTLVLSEDGYNPAFTPWFAMAANATNPAADLFGKPRSYLAGVPTPEEAALNGWRQIIALPKTEVAALLQENLGLDTALLGEPHLWLGEAQRSEGGYVSKIEVGGTEVSGLRFWQEVLLRDGKPLLPSPAFEAEVSGDEFLFTVYGQGHGCGLSQAGARLHAEKDGWTYERILQYYYPGTDLLEWT